MKLWIDDIRLPPNKSWTWVKNSTDAVKMIYSQPIEEISFDHDLGGVDTAYRVATLIEELAYKKRINRMIWHVHSANPVGHRNIEMAMKNADKYWNNMAGSAG
jgi:ribosomal protein L18